MVEMCLWLVVIIAKIVNNCKQIHFLYIKRYAVFAFFSYCFENIKMNYTFAVKRKSYGNKTK